MRSGNVEDRISEKADEIADRVYGRDFNDLPKRVQMQIWMQAEEAEADDEADRSDHTYEELRDKAMCDEVETPEQAREHWLELELMRRLGK